LPAKLKTLSVAVILAVVETFISIKYRDGMGGACSTNGGRERRGFGVGKPEGKRPLGLPRCRLEDNIKMVHQEVGWRGMDWIELA